MHGVRKKKTNMVRFLNEQDLSNIVKIEEESFFFISDMVVEDSNYALGVFNDQNKLIGFCSVGIADSFGSSNNEDIALSDLYIILEERNKGYGKELIQKAINYAKTQNARIVLDLWEDDLKMLYSRFGFLEFGDNSMILKL